VPNNPMLFENAGEEVYLGQTGQEAPSQDSAKASWPRGGRR